MDIGSNTVSCLNRRKNTKNIKKSKNTVDNHRNLWYKYSCDAEVAELADAQASGACGSNTVRVQVPPSALFIFCLKELTEQTASSFFLYITFHNIQTKFKSKTGSSKIALCLRLLPGINKKIKKWKKSFFKLLFHLINSHICCVNSCFPGIMPV